MDEMSVDTLLTRQMELHTTLRQPPKNAEQLMQVHDTMRNYHMFFRQLPSIAEKLHSDVDTVFQAFMYISLGGAVSFDKQHQDGSVPMHQAKVLARPGAIELEPALREAIPVKELMVYVGLSKDLRTTLRVKVEDANDLRTAAASVSDGLAYLDYIRRCSGGNADRMFAFYMVEEPGTLERMLAESLRTQGGHSPYGESVTSAFPTDSASLCAGTLRDGDAWTLSGDGSAQSVFMRSSLTPLPSPLSGFCAALREQCALAGEGKCGASARLKAARTVLDWLTAVPTEFFAQHVDEVLNTVTDPLCALAAEKRSALCRFGCNGIALLIQRLSHEPYLTHRGDAPALVNALTSWTKTLCRGIYVTIAAISSATDSALRELVLESHGHRAVVAAVLQALENGTQTELRRRCLGYLALALVAASAVRQRQGSAPARPDGADSRRGSTTTTPARSSVPSFSALLVAPAQRYVQIGDSPSRKMARALCAVLRAVAKIEVPTADPKTERLILLEQNHILPYLDQPRELERVLFETNNFVSSLRPGTGSLSVTQRSSVGSSAGGGSGEESDSRGPGPRQERAPVGHGSPKGPPVPVLTAARPAPLLTAVNPMDTYPPRGAAAGVPRTGKGGQAGGGGGGGGAGRPVAISLEAPLRKPSRRPSQLPPIAHSAVEGDEIYDTSASLDAGAAGSATTPEGGASKGRSREGGASDRLLPLSLQPVRSRSPRALESGGALALSPKARGVSPRQTGSEHSPATDAALTGPTTAGPRSPVAGAGSLRVSESLRRKIGSGPQ